MSISEKRKRLMELVKTRLNTKRRKVKREELLDIGKEASIRRKKLFAHVYKKMFRNGGRKVRLLNRVNDGIGKETCSGSKRKKRRVVLDSGGVCFGNRESANERLRISSTVFSEDVGPRCENVLRTLKPGQIQHGSVELSEFQFEVSSETRNHVLPYVNKLRDYWHRGHNAVIFDEQDRLLKVVFFVLSLLDNVNQPVLIIAATRVLSLWEAEFLKWSKSTNVVTYKGNKYVRNTIRASRFYDENGSISFQVLLSSPEVIIEDSEMLDHIKWELIVIDECQRSIISMYSKKIKMLVADMKLLTVTDEAIDIKDIRQRYQNILSMLDFKCEDIPMDADVETYNDTHTLKERLSPFIAFECKFSTTEIKEYWVPVHLSSMQIEQYCSILYSNLEALSSCTKNLSSVQNILKQICKCCDHPYLVDPTLRNSSKRDDLVDPLGAEIEVSGKLQVLDKLLLEIKQSGLRAVVLFQSVESLGNVTIGDILDDLVHQRFGQDSYVRIIGKVPSITARRKRTETLKMFNNVENGKFVCLFDSKACHPGIQLSRIDVVILFNSDWNPSYDIRSLQKITSDPNCEPLRVVRLYSSFTVEEKALIFSKNGKPLESYINLINWTTSHQLLTWGASYLFTKLQNQTDSSFIDDLVHELSFLLGRSSGKTGPTNRSIISNADLRDGSYSKSIMLLGETEAHTNESSSIDEYLIENRFSDFWSNLLKESDHHKPKNSCSRLSRRVQKSSKNDFCWLEEFGALDNATTSSPSAKTKPRSKRKKHDKAKQSMWAGALAHFCGHQSSPISPTRDQGEIRRGSQLARSRRNKVQQCENNQSPNTSSSTPFEAEIERIQKEQEQVNKLRQEKKLMLLSECKKEISEVRKKYDALVNESETFATNEMKILEEYYTLVNANNLLAEILSQNYNETFNLKNTDKEIRVPQIPSSTLIRPTNPCSTSFLTTNFSEPSVIRSGIRTPAPHLRSNPLLFSSLYNQPATLDPFLAPLLTQSSSQTPPYTQTESNYEVYQVTRENLPDLPLQFESFYNTGGPSFPLLDSNCHTF